MAFLLLFFLSLVFTLVLMKFFPDPLLALLLGFGTALFYINSALVFNSFVFHTLSPAVFLIESGLLCLLFLVPGPFRVKTGLAGIRSFLRDKTDMRIFLFSLAVLIINILINAYNGPVEWDSVTTYDLRARYFLSLGKITSVEPKEGIYFGVFKYPILSTTLHLFFYLFKTQGVKALYSFFAFSLSMGVGGFVYLLTQRRRASLIFGFLLFFLSPVITFYSFISYPNLLFAFYYLISLMTLFLFLRSREQKYLITSALSLAVCFWIRMEAVFFLPTVFFLFLCFKNKKWLKDMMLYAAVAILAGCIWYLVIYLENGLTENMSTGIFKLGQRADALKNLHSIKTGVFYLILKYFVGFINHTEIVFGSFPVNIFLYTWYLFPVLMFIKKDEQCCFGPSFLIWALVANLVMWFMTWYFAFGDWAIRLSGLRTLLHFYPVLFIFIIQKLVLWMPAGFLERKAGAGELKTSHEKKSDSRYPGL
ncbi:MAG: hypothetical protein PHF84_00645 [bacterium]|nr:hypothetical protein [bacterium]